jgi:pyruvate kinase
MAAHRYFDPTKKQIIVTLGPSSIDPTILRKIAIRDVDFVRINLSHTPEDRIEETIQHVVRHIQVPLIIDTEGSQIRTGNLGCDHVELTAQDRVSVHDHHVACNDTTLYVRPEETLAHLAVGDLIFIDFDTVILRVDDVSTRDEGRVICTVISGGVVGNNKAVTVQDQAFTLPSLSRKDIAAVTLARQYTLPLINLSFCDQKEDVLALKSLYPEAVVISKIETRRGVDNLDEILDVSDAILIDRGDLSREVPLERIAFAQKIIIRRARSTSTPVFVATNLLDTMMRSLRPSRAEVNDIINTLLDGASGLVLAAETAIGQYPVQTIDFMRSLCNETASIEASGLLRQDDADTVLQCIETTRYITSPIIGSSLPPPHGGRLIDRLMRTRPSAGALAALPRLEIDDETAMDAEQIGIGTFSPLEGFMGGEDFHSVLDRMRLASGVAWTIPIVILVDASTAERFDEGTDVLLVRRSDQRSVAVLHLDSKFAFNAAAVSEQWFGTGSRQHPGVARFMDAGPRGLGGKVDLIERLPRPYKHHELTPSQTRRIFESMGWTKILGFHTRNIPHRAHEFIQRHGVEDENCDGLFIQPVVGRKKAGDFETGAIIEAYDTMMREVYPRNKVVFGTFATASRYAGPREAVFTAICRQNFGCSHFAVGRDHTGVGTLYSPEASRTIFDQFEDLAIKVVQFDEVVFCEQCARHVQVKDCTHEAVHHRTVSGTLVRELFERGQRPPDWSIRPEIVDRILRMRTDGQQVFVDG